METIKGTVKKIIFQNEESGYKVMKIRIPSGLIVTVLGEFGPEVVPGTIANFHGDYRKHHKYGTGFKATSFNISHNVEEIKSIELFIDAISPNIGSERAHLIVKHFGSETITMLDNEPARLIEVEGIGKVSADSLAEAWNTNRNRWKKERQDYTLRAFLNSLGVRERKAKKILAYFGGGLEAELKIRENPYILTEVDRFGFSTADFIARKLGILESDPLRLIAFIQYALDVICPSKGHLYLTLEDMIDQINKFSKETNTTFLNKRAIAVDDIIVHLKELIEKGKIIKDYGSLYSKKCYLSEALSTSKICSIIKEESDLVTLNKESVDEHIIDFEFSNNLTLSDEQRKALYYFVEKKVYAITGLPGTGKTLVLKAIVSLLRKLRLNLTLMAPTGISAKKMASTVGYDAYTIHRRLGFRGDSWVFGEDNKYETDVVIIDESCLPYKQFVNLADGSKKYIGTIVNQKLPVEVLTYNFNKEIIEPKRVIDWFKYPYKNPLYKIKLSKAKNRERQRILRCTGNHKIYLEVGVKKASEIRVGNKVLVKGTFLNPFQKSFLLGAVLGDSHLSNKSSGRIITFVHGQKQKEYLFLKYRVFDCVEPYQCRGGYVPEKKLWRCQSRVIDDLDEIYTYTYPNGKREITKEWLDQIDEIGLAVWYMDNGSLTSQNGHSYTALLHTQAFSKKENDMIVSWLKNKWGLNSSVYKSKKYYLIRLTCESAIKFWGMISSWVIPLMAYKFPKGYEPGFKEKKQNYIKIAPYPVQEIQRYEPKGNTRKFIYDICVEDNHNYLSNDTLVSNSMIDQEVFYRLLSALRSRVHIIFVGDNNQLPSVGAGNVLKELITCGQIPIIKLEQIFRQDEASDIIRVAHRIKNGDTNLSLFKPDPKADVFFYRESNIEKILDFIIKVAQKYKKERRAFQIITPRNEGPLSVNELNEGLQAKLNPAGPETECSVGKFILRRGDRVIIIKNDYELGVFNGEVGKVVHVGGGKFSIELEEKTVDIGVDEALEKVKLAYSLTVHRCISLNTFITTPNGFIRMNKIKKGNKVHISKRESQNVLWHGDTGIKRLVRIKTKRGYFVDSSEKHKFLIADNEEHRFTRVKNIKKGVYACINRDQINGKAIKISVNNIRGVGITPRKKINLPEYLDEDTAWLLGSLIGNGSYTDKTDGTVEFTHPEHLKVLNEFDKITTTFGLNCRPHYKKNKLYGKYVCSKNFRDWLYSIGYNYVTAIDKDIPDMIFKASISCKLSFIAGLIDSDGSVNKIGLIRYVTVSTKLAYNLQLLLLSCGIVSSVSMTISKLEKENNRYNLSINMNSSFTFFKLLRCEKKRHRLKDTEKEHSTNDRNIPYGKKLVIQFFNLFNPEKTRGRKGEGLNALPYKKIYGVLRSVKKGNLNLTYNFLKKMINILEEKDIPIPVIFTETLNRYTLYDKIKSIEYLDTTEETKDMEINHEHKYIANGFISHNSQGQEYPFIILPFINQFGKNMLQRNLLYTAITRAKEKVIVIGHGSAIEKAINNSSVQKRNTNLGERIKRCLQKQKKDFSPIPHGEQQSFPYATPEEEQSL